MWRNMNEAAGGRPIFGTPFVGLLGSEILAATGSGPNGPGAMFNDGLVAGSRYRMLLSSPASFPGVVYEDGSLEATASVSTTYRLYEDNILVSMFAGVFDIPLDVVIGTAPPVAGAAVPDVTPSEWDDIVIVPSKA